MSEAVRLISVEKILKDVATNRKITVTVVAACFTISGIFGEGKLCMRKIVGVLNSYTEDLFH